MSRRLSSWPRRWRATASIASSVTAAPPIDLPRVRADSWPSRVRSRMYSRSIPDSAASTVNTTPDGSWEPCSSPVRNSRPIPAARSCSASAASSMPRPSRLCSCTTIVTAAPDARISRARATARSSSGRVTARVEIFSAKIRVMPRPSASPSGCRATGGRWTRGRTRSARARPDRACCDGGAGSSVQAEPGLQAGGTGTARALARRGTSRNRRCGTGRPPCPGWSGRATRPGPRRTTSGSRWPQRGGNRCRSPGDRFMDCCNRSSRMQQPMKHCCPC